MNWPPLTINQRRKEDLFIVVVWAKHRFSSFYTGALGSAIKSPHDNNTGSRRSSAAPQGVTLHLNTFTLAIQKKLQYFLSGWFGCCVKQIRWSQVGCFFPRHTNKTLDSTSYHLSHLHKPAHTSCFKPARCIYGLIPCYSLTLTTQDAQTKLKQVLK